MKKAAIYGVGGFAKELAWLLSTLAPFEAFALVGFIDERPTSRRELLGYPVLSWDEFVLMHKDASVAIGVGAPAARKALASKCAAAGFASPTLIHRNVQISSWVAVAPGVIVCAGSVLTVDVVIEQHVLVGMDCTIGHDSRIGEYSTLSPGVHVAGNVHVGKEVLIGAGATIINGTPQHPLVIADRTVIAPGACVTRDTQADGVYAGVPATLQKHVSN